MLVFCIVNLHIRIRYGFHFCTLENKKQNKKEQFATCTSPRLLKVVRLVFWSGVVARSRFALTDALRAQKLDL